jgi:hypothetical protein
MNRTVKRLVESDKITFNLVSTLSFYGDRVGSVTQQSQSTVFYGQVYEAYEVQDFFYIYLSRGRAFLVEKSGFTLGTPENFRRFLFEKLGTRFKIKVKGSIAL